MPVKPEKPQQPYPDIMATRPIDNDDYNHRMFNLENKEKLGRRHRKFSIVCTGVFIIIAFSRMANDMTIYDTYKQAISNDLIFLFSLILIGVGVLMFFKSHNTVKKSIEQKYNLNSRKGHYQSELLERRALQSQYQQKIDAYNKQLDTYMMACNNFPAYVDQEVELIKQSQQSEIRKRKYEIVAEKNKKEAEISDYENAYIAAFTNKMVKIAEMKIINTNDNFFTCNINGISYNLISFYAKLWDDPVDNVVSELSNFTDITYEEALNFIDETRRNGMMPRKVICETLTSHKENIAKQDRISQNALRAKQQKLAEEEELRLLHQAKCPMCGSPDIGVVHRGYDWLLLGWIGSNQALNVCKKCGYKWKAGY